MGCIMSKCNRCSIDVFDNSHVCPLCNGVLDKATTTDYHSKSNMYPDVMPKIKKLKLFIKIFVFVSIVIEGILILVNSLTDSHFKWSLICGVVLTYACFTVIFTFQRDRGHRTKLFMQAVAAMLLVYLIDVVIGYNGWSLSYAIPCIIMSMDGIIIILMLANIRHWQNYLLLQIMMLFVSIIFVVFAACNLVRHPVLTIIAAAISGLCLLGSFIFGDKKAVGELTRRFRI